MLDESKLTKLKKESKVASILEDKFKQLEQLKEKAEQVQNIGENGVMHVSIAELDTNPFQPRIEMNEQEIEELANSIEENGLLNPISIVQKENNRYYILAGHRRVEAHKKLNRDTIPAILIKDKNSKRELAINAMIENIQRVQLTPIEEAILYKRILDEEIFTSIRALAKALGKDHSNLAKKINVLKLDSIIIEDIINNHTTTDLSSLAMINSFTQDPELQWELYEILITEGRVTLRKKIQELKNDAAKKVTVKPIAIKIGGKSTQIKINKKLDEETAKKIEDYIKQIVGELDSAL